MNVVPGCAASSDSSDCMSRSKLGKSRAEVRPLGLLEQLLEPLVAAVDRARRTPPGRPVWMSTGSPSSPAAANTGARRSSSGSTSCAALVADAEAEVLPDLEAARAGVARSPQALDEDIGVEARAADRAQVDVAERDEAAGVRAVVAIEVALELVAPEAVEVDDRLDADLVERRDQLADVRDRPGALRPAHELGRVERRASRPRARASGRGGCARRSQARAAAARPSAGSTSRERGSQSPSGRLIA